MRFPIFIILALLVACGEEHTEVLTIGPYTKRCQGFIEQDCFMEYNEEAGRWHFFYEAIQGFEFEPGYIYTLEVRLEDRGTEIQDVGRYSYHLIRILDRVEAPADFDYTKKREALAFRTRITREKSWGRTVTNQTVRRRECITSN